MMSKLFLVLAAVVAIAVIVTFVTQQVWKWVVPDLFPGAVEQGLIEGDISLWVAFKLMLFLGVLLGGLSSSSS